MASFLKKKILVSVLIIVAVILCAANYTPHTWLTGWDTLHPELNFSLNFSRLFIGVWRDEQGLGAVAGHSHMADIPRVIFLLFFNLFLPTSMVRYAYIFGMFIIGPLGVYYLLHYLLARRAHKEFLSFLGGLFYITSAGTIQQFYVPFEMFPTQYAYLPWLVLYSLKILKKFSRKDIVIYTLLTILATPQAYAAQLWYAFFGTYTLSLMCYVFAKKSFADSARRAILLVVLTLLLNSFWLLPNLYYVATQGEVPRLSKQNRLYSQEFRLRNREFGTLQEVALLKGFYFDWSIYDFKEERLIDLMPAWKSHYANPLVQVIGYSIFGLAIYGFFIVMKKKDYRDGLCLVPFFVLPFVLLANKVAPFNFVFEVLLKFPLFEEALRFVFTKFSILLTFSYAVFFVLGLSHILSFLRRNIFAYMLFIPLAAGILLLGLPALKGNLISPIVRVKIPDTYFDMWDFMRTQPEGTVLALPLHTFSGWQYYDWGYQGSGFIWFPLQQSIMDRDFDRWSSVNEETFRELQYALYAKNPDAVRLTLAKYNISYIMWDASNTTFEEKNREQITFSREIKDILNELVAAEVIEPIWKINNMHIYRIRQDHKRIEVYNKLPNVLPAYTWGFVDAAYHQHGVYLSDMTKNPDVFYPFRNYLTIYDRFNRNLISIDTQHKTYSINIPQTDLFKTKLKTPNVTVESEVFADTYLSITPNKTAKLIIKPILPQQSNITGIIELDFIPEDELSINGHILLLAPIPLVGGDRYIGQSFYNLNKENVINGRLFPINFEVNITALASIESSLPPEFINISAERIYKANQHNADVRLAVEPTSTPYIRIASQNTTTSGVLLDLSKLSQSRGYVMSITSRNIKGIPLRICLFSLYSNMCSLIDEVSKNAVFSEDTFIIPPYGDGNGYSLRIDNITYGGEETINDLLEVVIFPIPFNFLSQTYVETHADQMKTIIDSGFTAYLNHTLYKVRVDRYALAPDAHPEVVLWRSYSDGWVAIDTSRRTFLPSHHSINNWANGWTLEAVGQGLPQQDPQGGQPAQIIIFFWPQLLEYAGFILLCTSLLWVFLFRKKNQ